MSCQISTSGDASSLADSVQSLLDTLSSNNLSQSEAGSFLNNLVGILNTFAQANYNSSSASSSAETSDCTTCSGNGICEEDTLYLKKICKCDSGWMGSNCDIPQSDQQALQDLTTQIINQIAKVPLRLTMAATWSESYLQALLSITSSSFTSLSDVEGALQIVYNIVSNDFTSKSSADVFDPVKMTIAAQIVDECLRYIFAQDCFLQQSASVKHYDNSMQILTWLGSLQLWGKAADSGKYTLQTTDFELYSERVSPGRLPGFVIAPPNQPRIVLKGASSSSTTPVDIQVVFWINNLMQCPQQATEANAPPPLAISLNEPDSTSSWSEAGTVSAQVSYPVTSSQQKPFTNCSSSSCTPETVTIDGQTFFECKCPSIAEMSSSNAFQDLFKKSNLFKIARFAALAGYDYLHSWAFWILWGLTAWFLLTAACIKFRVLKPTKFRRDFGDKRKQNDKHRRRRTKMGENSSKMNFFKALYYGLKVIHSLLITPSSTKLF